tara:strand:+ start:52 stop:921 length:870 start_codon:yes stop_codon:yes gene_type:complete
MLNEDGGIEADLTIACLDNNYFRIISSAATRERDKFHIKKHLSDGIELHDVTDEYCVLGIFGPKSRMLMEELCKDDFSNVNFEFANSKFVLIDGVKIWTQRLSYVGELGYELYINNKDSRKIYEKIIEKGKKFNLSNCGMHALDTMRMECGFLHWGHDISPEENQYQCGLDFTISFKKKVNFIGREALEKIKDKKSDRKFSMFTLKNNEPGKPLILHDEPIYLEDKIIGRTTSGNYSFNFRKNLAFGYIENKFTEEELSNKNLYIEIEKVKYSADLLQKPLKYLNFKKI